MAEWIPPDQDARDEIAYALDTNLLVEAGAGSGKTTAMVDRMIQLIRTGTATVDEIAAVTFTRKAATELRERFQLRLEEEYRARTTTRDDGTYPDPTERDRIRGALDELDRCFVGTIHSFCARLLRERPLEARVPPNFQEISGPEEEEFRTECWSRALERLGTRPNSRILRRLAELGLRPAQLKGIFVEVSENPDVHYHAPRLPAPDPARLDRLRNRLERLLDDSIAALPAEEPDMGWDALQSKVRRLRFSRAADDWNDHRHLLNALDDALSSNSITQNRWPDKALAKELKARWEEFAAEGGPAWEIQREWLAHRYPHVLRFARAVAGFYAAERRRAGLLNFQDLLLETARLLRTDPSARAELGRRYRRLLVDEFQDTDPIQAEVVFLLAAEAEGEVAWHQATPRPGALFVVGDPKQSIYRFRRADIAVYNQVKARFREFGRVLYLTANFRSTRPIEALVNTVFHDLFPAEETTYQAAFAPLNVVPVDRERQGVAWYGFPPHAGKGTFTGRRITIPDTELCAAWIDERIRLGERRPEDFMILAYRKDVLHEYARALEALDIPVQVTGGSLGVEEDLADLILLLRALGDPEHAVLTVAVLEGTHFGLSHEHLYEHLLAGGNFNFLGQEQPGGPVGDALRRLREFSRLARSLPADAAVAAIVERLGIIPHAAAGDLGATRAGALFYALDAVRQAALAGKTSLAQAVEVLESALDAEVDAPLIPGEAEAVRIMNLHKAKGLEAPVVVLAYPARRTEYPPTRHIARNDVGDALGYVLVGDSTRRFGPGLARPLEWEEFAAEEALFAAAEDDRLLYVAATRAREELVIARCDRTNENSFWAKLHPALDDPALATELTISPPPEAGARRGRLTLSEAELDSRIEEVELARARLAAPTYEAASVSARARGTGPEIATPWVGRGTEWGTIVHRALEVAASVATEELYAICRDILIAAERPLTPAGEPAELDELVATITGFHDSPLWQRARYATAMQIEVPFALAFSPDDARRLGILSGQNSEGGRDIADGQGAHPGGDPIQLVEGVIDLAFRDHDGRWTIVDYKSDRFPNEASRRARTEQYRRQVDLYAICWARLTGEPVAERILVFTSEGREVRW